MRAIILTVRFITMDILGIIHENKVTKKADFKNDLGADSIDIAELIMEFEKEFNIQIPDDKANQIRTVGQAVNYIKNHAIH